MWENLPINQVTGRTIQARLHKCQFVNNSCYFLQFSRESAKKPMEIKSTVVDWAFMPWKLNPRPWKCFKEQKCCYFGQNLEKIAMKREYVAENWKINRWKENSTSGIGFLGHKCPIIGQQNENNVLENISPVEEAIFMTSKHFPRRGNV